MNGTAGVLVDFVDLASLWSWRDVYSARCRRLRKISSLSVTTLKRWIVVVERKESGVGPAAAKLVEVRELKKLNGLLEQAN